MAASDRTSYRTVQGDTWDSIARALWGSEYFMHQLLDANPDCADILIFPAGTTLRVPQADTSALPANLPPWMTDETA